MAYRTTLTWGCSVATALCFAIVLAAPIAAFEIVGFWMGGEAPLWVNPNFPEADAGSPEEQFGYIACAAQAWHDQSRSAFHFNMHPPVSSRNVNPTDEENLLLWINADGNGALAATLPNFDEDNPGQIASFDIVFFSRSNDAPLRWSGPGEPPPGTYDLRGIATHELGHAVGIGHSDDREATMYPVAVNRGLYMRTLAADDRAALDFLYERRTNASPAAELVSVEPSRGPVEGGNEVTVYGKNFTSISETRLFIDAMEVSRSRFEIVDCSRIRILEMPPHASGGVDLEVANSIGTGALKNAYAYRDRLPTLLSIHPDWGPLEGGSDVVVRGLDLGPEVSVTIGGLPVLEQRRRSREVISAKVPAGSAPGPAVVALVEDGQEVATLADPFRYTPYALRPGVVAVPTGTPDVSFELVATSPEALSAVVLNLTYDPARLQLREITTAGTAVEGAEFVRVDIDNTAGCVGYEVHAPDAARQAGQLPGQGGTIQAGARVSIGAVHADLSSTVAAGSGVELTFGCPGRAVATQFTLSTDGSRAFPWLFPGAVLVTGRSFRRGDADFNDVLEITDALFLLNYLFAGGPAPPCQDGADADDNGALDIVDPLRILLFLFSALSLPPPSPAPGPDATADPLSCTGVVAG